MECDAEADAYVCAIGKMLSIYRESKDKYSKRKEYGDRY